MRYCINFYGEQIDLLNEANEINIDISKLKEIKDLEEFCELHKNQRINLCINDYEDAINKQYLEYVFEVQKKLDQYDIVIRLPGWDTQFCPNLKEKYPKSKIFFNIYIIDWDNLWDCINHNVSDVYIAEAMGFELDKIAPLLHKNNIQIRVFPNVAQAAAITTSGILKFWIRPEDIEFYEPYIDVCEFYGEYEKQIIYYDIYAKDKKWVGNLKEIIIGLNEDIINTTLLPRFARKRIKCDRECMKNDKCHMCQRILELSETLDKSNLRIAIDKEENNNG